MSINNTKLTKGFKGYWRKKGEKCPACNASDKPKGGILKEKTSKFGKFVACSRYPECKYSHK